MKKTLIVMTSLMFLAPSIALAAWWNPFTWFSPKVSVQSVATTSVSTIATTTKIVQKKIIPTPVPINLKPSTSNISVTQTPAVKIPTVVAPPISSNQNVCNGVTYSACPSGTDFTCPSNRSGYCAVDPNYYAQQQQSAAQKPTQSSQTTTAQTQQQTVAPASESNSITYTPPQRSCIDPGSGEVGLGSLHFSSDASDWTINYTATSNSSLRNQDIMTAWGFGSFSLVDYPSGSFDVPIQGNINAKTIFYTPLYLDNPVAGSDVVLTITSATDAQGNIVSGLPITIDTGVIASCQN